MELLDLSLLGSDVRPSEMHLGQGLIGSEYNLSVLVELCGGTLWLGVYLRFLGIFEYLHLLSFGIFERDTNLR